MTRFHAANTYQTLLSAAINNTQTTFDVTTVAGRPATPFKISIAAEIMDVTAVAGNTFTVTRGTEGTTAAPHASGARVENRLTAAVYNNLWDNVDTHAALTTAHSAVSAPTASRIIIRDAAGRAQVVDGAVAGDIATRGQVDTRAPLRLTIRPYTVSHTLVMADGDGALVTMDAAGALTLTVPANASVAFPIGTQILVQRLGAGAVTLVAGGGVTLQSAGGLLALRVQFSVAGIIKRLSDTWAVVGDLA